jgi:glycosyltransferase involved in cell wall biosynthesis
VFPSLHENFGNVLVESLLCGTPIVSSPNVGAAAFFRGTDAVRIVALRPTDWAQELSDRIAMPQDARRQNPITADVAAICSPIAVTMAIESMYLGILSRPQKSGAHTRRPSKHAL